MSSLFRKKSIDKIPWNGANHMGETKETYDGNGLVLKTQLAVTHTKLWHRLPETGELT